MPIPIWPEFALAVFTRGSDVAALDLHAALEQALAGIHRHEELRTAEADMGTFRLGRAVRSGQVPDPLPIDAAAPPFRDERFADSASSASFRIRVMRSCSSSFPTRMPRRKSRNSGRNPMAAGGAVLPAQANVRIPHSLFVRFHCSDRPGKALSWMADGNQINRLVVAGQGESLPHVVIMEGAHGHSSKSERDGLQQHVLGRVARFQMYVPRTALAAVFAFRPFIYRSDNEKLRVPLEHSPAPRRRDRVQA